MPDIKDILNTMQRQIIQGRIEDLNFNESRYIWVLGADVMNVLGGWAEENTNVPMTDWHDRAICTIYGIKVAVDYSHRKYISLCKEVTLCSN